MDQTKAREHVARLKAALTKLNQSAGGTLSQDADAALCDAWVAACQLEKDAGAPVALESGAAA